MKYVIIGSSAAGIQAAEDIRKLDKDSEIGIVSKEKDLPYSRCLISRFVDGRLSEDDLYFKTRHFFKDYDIKPFLNTTVTKIERGNKKILTRDNNEIRYDKLLLATGSRPWVPKIDGLYLEGVYSFHSLDTARSILERIKKAKNAVVIGAGFVGLEASYALSRAGLKVTVIERCPQILPNQLDEEASLIIQKDLEALGVEVILNESLSSINGAISVRDVILANKSSIQCDIVIMATGMESNKELAMDAGIDADKGILVDEFLKTIDPNISAAGDVIEIMDISTGKRMPSATWFNAVLQGKFAASNIAGQRRRYAQAVGIQNAVQFHQIPAISYGSTLIEGGSHEDYEVITIRKGKDYKKLVLKGNKICGMIFVGDITKSGFYAALIRSELDISKYKEKLLDPDFSYAYFKDEDFDQISPYHKVSPCWESPQWWLVRPKCIGI